MTVKVLVTALGQQIVSEAKQIENKETGDLVGYWLENPRVVGYTQNEEQGGETNWKKIKTKTTTEEDYHTRMEQRLEDLMQKVDAGTVKLEDLTPEDRQVIIEIRNQNKE